MGDSPGSSSAAGVLAKMADMLDEEEGKGRKRRKGAFLSFFLSPFPIWIEFVLLFCFEKRIVLLTYASHSS